MELSLGAAISPAAVGLDPASGPAGSFFYVFAADGFLPGCPVGASSELNPVCWCFFSCVTFLAWATLRGSDIRPQ